MTRFFPPGERALVLVVTACGAGAKPAPQVTEVLGIHIPRRPRLTLKG